MKKSILNLALSVSLTLAAPAALADEWYPKNLNLRSFGTNQGNTPDCAAHADVGALEQAFINHGLDVKFSLFYRHAYNWRDQSEAQLLEHRLALSPEDKQLLAKAGPMIPEYMWPEDTSGFNPFRTGTRPSPSKAAAWDPAFPSAGAHGFKDDFRSFKPGHSNSAGVAHLKNAIASGHGVVISLHSSIMGWDPDFKGIQLDDVTGLMTTKYSIDVLKEALEKKDPGKSIRDAVSHAVVAVAYDDSLYADQGYATPGAIIVRNSWNSSNEFRAVKKPMTPEQTAEFAKMRGKLFPINLPGYYAIPTQYFQDLVAHGAGGFSILSMNYVTYSAKYQEFSNKYKTVTTPYACDTLIVDEPGTANDIIASDQARRTVQYFGLAWARMGDESLDPALRAKSKLDVYRLALNEATGRITVADHPFTLRYARWAVNESAGIDRAADFYRGAFDSYFCVPQPGEERGGVWPKIQHYEDPVYKASLNQLSSGTGVFSYWIPVLKSLADLKAGDKQ